MLHTEIPLYGGAMQCRLPQGLDDVSEFRQVPDNQEVFTSAETGVCVIVELMSKQSVSNTNCAEFFFRDLSSSNTASYSEITFPQTTMAQSDIPLIPCHAPTSDAPVCEYACVVGGLQRVSKFTNEVGSENIVFVGLGVLRFPSPVSTDILISVTAPQQIAPHSSEATVVRATISPSEALDVLRIVMGSLRVNDWTLFVPE
jgi:hypothetical protein